MASLRTLPTARLLSRSSLSSSFSRRSLHHRVPLPYAQEQGLPGFLSPQALKTVAVDWQQGVLDRLNALVRGTEIEDKSVLQTLKETAQDPSQTLAFNYASEALNNSFFLSTLSPTPSAPSPSSSFSQQLASTPSLGSFPALISHFSSHVSGLHPSSGAYVWLVTDPNGNLGVVGTYAGGTVLVKERRQTGYGAYAGKELRVLGEKVEGAAEQVESGESAPVAAPAWESVPSSRRSPASSPSSSSNLLDSSFSPTSVFNSAFSSSASLQVGKSLHPLLCLSVHPHCYIEDYGVWGRDEYVKKWWGAVDWKKVEEAYEAFTRRARI
ncbi:hypothetical protein JCM11251_005426 [Rhodosporidiobolus azoricus]